MNWLEIVILALVQGLTEFLPISSSAHLILIADWLGANGGLAFDVAVHLGTLLAALWFFRKPLLSLLRRSRQTTLPLTIPQLIVASLPVLIVGGIFASWIDSHLRTASVIAWTTIVFGIALAVSERMASGRASELPWTTVAALGLAQVLALVPGVSRSGITMTAAMALGIKPARAATISFWMSLPVLAAAGSYGAFTLIQEQAGIDWTSFALGATISAVVAGATMQLFVALVSAVGMLPFAIYRVLLGIMLLLLL